MAVQGIDGSALINAFRQGKADRQAEQAAQAAAAEAEHKRSVMERLFSPQTESGGGGVTGQMGMADTPSVETAWSDPSVFEGGAAASPTEPNAAPAAEPSNPYELNPDALKELAVIDPKMAVDLHKAFGELGKDQLEKANAANTAIGQGAYYLSQLPQNQRAQAFQNLIPHLEANGMDQGQIREAYQQLQQAGWSDAYINFQIARSGDLDKMMGKILDERENAQGKIVNFGPESGAMRVLPNGEKDILAVPGVQGVTPGQTAETGAAIPQEAINALLSGEGTPEQFDEYFGAGAAEMILGGGGGNAAGNFPRN